MPIDARQFQALGYGRLADAVDPARVRRLGAAVDAVQARAGELTPTERALLVFERDLPAAGRDGIDADQVGDAIFIIGEPDTFDPFFEELLADPAVCDTARSLLGSDDIALHFMNVTLKHPRFGRSIGWHRDFPNDYICPAGADFLRLMLCLDGMDAGMGATRFLPGSHRLSDAAAIAEKRDAHRPRPPDEGAITLHCGAGDLVAIHPKVLHGGGPNRSARMRRNVVLQIGLASAALVTGERESMTGRRLA